MRRKNNRLSLLLWAAVLCSAAVVVSCSTTSALPEGEQLYIGIDKITYSEHENSDHFVTTQEEVEAALACEPNGALFGSSRIRSPFPVGLWVWNAFSKSESKFGKWMTNNIGKTPVLMSSVNPALHASVAQSVLRNHGYFRGKVGYEELTMRNPKKGKIRYDVQLNHLFTLDSIAYVGFPAVGDTLIKATLDDALIHRGDPFSVATLDAERNRITQLFRNNGYYYYQPSYASYLADTIMVPGKVQLRFQLADGIPEQANHKWYIGRTTVDLRKSRMERLTDSISRRRITLRFSGRRPAVRAGVLMRDIKLRRGQLFCYDDLMETENNILSSGLYSSVNFRFTPRDSTLTCDTLDMNISCVFDKKYDFYIETNIKGRTTGRMGPEVILGLTKRNALRGGETFDINLHGSYEWRVGTKKIFASEKLETYTVGLDASLKFPRLVTPLNLFNSQRRALRERRQRLNLKRRQYFSTPTTTLRLGFDVESRSNYFRMHTASGELTYRWQRTATSSHEFSPISVVYQFKNHTTDLFDSIYVETPFLIKALADQFITKMSYTYRYASPKGTRNPIAWETTVSEAGNLLSLGFMAAGKKWNEQDKTLFNNPYAQFVKINTDFVKRWQMTEKTSLVAHVNAGLIWNYGNSDFSPFSEQFYVGGASSIRAFSVRSLGPGRMLPETGSYKYLLQTGDLKLLANLEYRFNIVGSLNGALFLDAGNVWNVGKNYADEAKFKFKRLPKDLALGTGFGLRYDLEFLVLRIDWGFALHAPYETSHTGYFNMRKFSEIQTINFAVGYPF